MFRKFKLLKFVAFSVVFSLSGQVLAYSDISNLDKDFQAIQYVESLGLFEEDVFNPDQVMTKAELFEALLRADGFDVNLPNSIELDLQDLSPEYEPYFERMYDLGVFEYNENIALANQDTKLKKWNALRYFFRYKGIPVQRVLIDSSFLEAEVDNIFVKSVYAPFVDRGLKLGLIEAENRRYDLFGFFTRRDFAQLMYRFAILDASNIEGGQVIINVEQNTGVSSSLARVEQFRILEDVWNRANNDFLYADQIEEDKLLYGAIDGLVEALDDPYTTFQIPVENQALQDSLSDSYEGIGASLHFEDGKVIVISPLKNSPAERVGMQPGDEIVEVDGVSLNGKNLDDAIELIKGPAGTSVSLTVSRDGRELRFDIVRARVEVEYVTAEQTLDNILILRVNSFGTGLADSTKAILNSIDIDELNGIVIDLRNNPGGFVNEAVEMADIFMDAGEDVVQVNYKSRSSQTLKTRNSSLIGNKPVAIIINEGSASASEILAGALSSGINAVLVGETSFGKGTVQELVNYADKSSLKITTAEWLIPTDLGYRSINNSGVRPDFFVTISDEDVEAGNDAQLNKAIFELRN